MSGSSEIPGRSQGADQLSLAFSANSEVLNGVEPYDNLCPLFGLSEYQIVNSTVGLLPTILENGRRRYAATEVPNPCKVPTLADITHVVVTRDDMDPATLPTTLLCNPKTTEWPLAIPVQGGVGRRFPPRIQSAHRHYHAPDVLVRRIRRFAPQIGVPFYAPNRVAVVSRRDEKIAKLRVRLDDY